MIDASTSDIDNAYSNIINANDISKSETPVSAPSPRVKVDRSTHTIVNNATSPRVETRRMAKKKTKLIQIHHSVDHPGSVNKPSTWEISSNVFT